MKPLSSKARLKWAVDVANGDTVPNLEDVENFIRAPWVLYEFAPSGKPIKSVRTPPNGWERFYSDTAHAFRDTLEVAAAHYQLPTPQPEKRPVAVFDENLNRYVEREQTQIQTLPTRLIARLYDLVIEHGHLLSHCEAPARMKRGPRSKGKPKQKPKGKCGKLFLGKKIGQIYCSPTCAARTAGRRKKPRA